MLTAAIIATSIPIAIYLVVGFLPSSRSRSIKDYFIYNQTVSASDYANTSVSYALQMAAVFLFSYWACLYGLGALWVAVFWGLGFWLLLVLLPKFIDYHTKGTTMHEYLASSFRGGRRLQFLAAIATIVGLWGTMMAEVDYTIQIYSPILKTEKNEFLLGACFLVFGLLYIIINGYKAEVNTARLQVPVEYIGLIAVILFLLPQAWLYSGAYSFWVIFGLLMAVFVALIIGKLQVGWKTARNDPQLLIPLLSAFALIVVAYYSTGLPAGVHTSILNVPMTRQLYAQGWLGLFSLLIANALWMPVDLSTWQRISSVSGQGSTLLSNLKAGTRRVLFESPATWMLGVALGLVISAGGFLGSLDPSQGLSQLSTAMANRSVTIAGSSLVAAVLYPVFIVACLSVMMSTVHSLISAIAFTAHNDLFSTATSRASLTAARWWTIGLVMAGMVFYPYLRLRLGANLPTVLYGAYSAQLSLFVIAMLGLLRRRLSKTAAFASVLFGFLGTAVSVWLALRVTDPSVSVLPPIFAVAAAFIGYVIFFRPDISEPEKK